MNKKVNVVLRVLAVLTLSVLFSYLTFEKFGFLYIKTFNPVGSWLGSSVAIITGLPIAYSFFLLLLLTIFVSDLNKWVYGLLLLPVIIFEISFDPLHFYFPIIFAFIGWVIAQGILFVIKK